jgi:hypothetical protein
MAKRMTIRLFELELKKLIKERTGRDYEVWLLPQIRSTAKNEYILDKVTEELDNSDLTTIGIGSTGQQKTEVNPLLPYFDKLNRTLIAQFEALGLNYNTTPKKVTENTKQGGTDTDLLSETLRISQEL